MVNNKDQEPGRELPKDSRDVVNAQRRNFGFRYVWNKKGHPRLYAPNGGWQTLSMTPSDKRGYKNMVAFVNRNGGEWPPGKGKR